MQFWGGRFVFYIISHLGFKGLGSADILKTEISAHDLGRDLSKAKGVDFF